MRAAVGSSGNFLVAVMRSAPAGCVWAEEAVRVTQGSRGGAQREQSWSGGGRLRDLPTATPTWRC